jgi:DNA-binding transcriptional LysR family regulator
MLDLPWARPASSAHDANLRRGSRPKKTPNPVYAVKWSYRMRDDLSGLRALLHVARARSFRAAAAELRVTPSAVARASARSRSGSACASSNARPGAFREDGKDFEIAVDGHLVTNDGAVLVDAAVEGLGLAQERESSWPGG